MAKDDDEAGRKLPNSKDVVAAVRAINTAKKQVDNVNGKLGETLANAAEQKGVSLPVAKLIARLDRKEPYDRKRWIEDFAHACESMRKDGGWEDYGGDLAEMAEGAQKAANDSQRAADAKEFEKVEADPDAAAAADNAAKLKGMKPLPKEKAETSKRGKNASKREPEAAAVKARGEDLSAEEAGEPVGRLPTAGEGDLPAPATSTRKPRKADASPSTETAAPLPAEIAGEGDIDAPADESSVASIEEARRKYREQRAGGRTLQ